MRAIFRSSWLAAALWLTVMPAFSQSIFINEFLASNTVVLMDEAGQFDDWVELYNAGITPVDIGGMYITDDLSQPKLWKIPVTNPAATTIPAKGFLLLWFDKEMAQGVRHINAKLSADGEDLGLFAADGVTQIDALSFGPQSADISYGRTPDGGNVFQFFSMPTPGATNVNAPTGSFAEAPKASKAGGFFNSPFQLALSTTQPGGEIRYTLDGSEPDAASTLYSAPVQVGQTRTLRARTFAAGFQPSPVTTHSYLFGTSHTFPVVALSFKDADFFDPATGIYPNYEEDWERPVHVEFFEEDGTPGFSQEATVEIHGTGSANLPQKSLKLKAKAAGGAGVFNYPVFPDLPYADYKTLLLRNAGQDWNVTMFKDAFVTSLVGDLSDAGGIIQPPKLHLQGFRPGIVYLNGEYWGIHNIREHITENYIEQHFGLKDNEIDLLDNDNEAKAGDFNAWSFLVGYLNSNHFNTANQLSQLGEFVDLPEFLDYNAFNILIDNPDWPGNNYRRWRERVNNAKWRFIAFDLDLSCGLLDYQPGNIQWNTGNASNNALKRALDSTQVVWPNQHWATLPFRKPMQNKSFRQDFINRTADFLNVLFRPERVNARLDEFQALYQPEIQRHFDRWASGWNLWNDNIDILHKFINERPAYLRQHIVDGFEEVNGTAIVTLQAQPPNAGSIFFSTLTLAPDKLPWSGMYFAGVDIPATAAPAPGYVFKGWSDAGMGNLAVSKVNLSANKTVTAFFEKGSTAKDTIVINEINYNSSDNANSGDWVELLNPNSHAVNVSGWVFEDESGGFYSIPDGTAIPAGGLLLLVENAVQFASVHPSVANVSGDFGGLIHGFKLSNSSELIKLKNANLEVIDNVQYSDKSPWPVEADGTGSTLQLIHWKLDNALAQSWKAKLPTPGQVDQPPFKEQTINFPFIGDKVFNAPPFGISATATSGLPVIFSILSGPATVSGNLFTLTGGDGIVVVRASQPGDNIWLPAPFVYQSFQVKKPAGYCPVKAERPWWEWIERVQFGDIDHLSFKTPYGNFTSVSTELPIGEPMTLTITPAFSWEVFEEYFRAWIDYNHDGDFDDPGELVLEDNGVSQVSAKVAPPMTALAGATRLRIAMQRGKQPEPCQNFQFGEVQDYTVILTPDGSFLPPDNNQASQKLSTIKLSPNPASTWVGAHFTTKHTGKVLASIIDANGVEAHKEIFNLQGGEHYIEMDVSALPDGTFALHLQPLKQRPLTGLFVKVRQ